MLEPGECFGHPSLLTGMAPAFTVRAREPSTCALFGAEAGRRLLGTEAGAAYVARLDAQAPDRRRPHRARAARRRHHAGVARSCGRPTFCEPDEPLRDAAARLGEDGVSALLVRLGRRADSGSSPTPSVRAAVAVDGVPLDAPVRTRSRGRPVPTVPPTPARDRGDRRHARRRRRAPGVLDGERVCGMLSAADLLGLDARSPIALRHMLLGAPDEDALVRAAGAAAEAVPAAVARRRARRAISAGSSASSTTPSSRG